MYYIKNSMGKGNSEEMFHNNQNDNLENKIKKFIKKYGLQFAKFSNKKYFDSISKFYISQTGSWGKGIYVVYLEQENNIEPTFSILEYGEILSRGSIKDINIFNATTEESLKCCWEWIKGYLTKLGLTLPNYDYKILLYPYPKLQNLAIMDGIEVFKRYFKLEAIKFIPDEINPCFDKLGCNVKEVLTNYKGPYWILISLHSKTSRIYTKKISGDKEINFEGVMGYHICIFESKNSKECANAPIYYIPKYGDEWCNKLEENDALLYKQQTPFFLSCNSIKPVLKYYCKEENDE